jgi:Response regulator containing a CheY-like receiver domain and an HTH DNA-binding domain
MAADGRRLLIVADNQDITRMGLMYLCKNMGVQRVIEAKEKNALLKGLTLTPDAAVVLDYTLFDLVSADELLILQERFSEASWLLFSDELSEEFIRRILYGSENSSIVMKDAALEEISEALSAAMKSERFVCSRIISLLAHHDATERGEGRSLLTATEKEILKLIALGRTTKEIAAERFSSIHTIATHRKNIFRKLEVNNIHEATKYALRAGIIDVSDYYI